MKQKSSKQFIPSSLAEKLVPALLVVISLGLLAVIVVTALALLGFTPGA